MSLPAAATAARPAAVRLALSHVGKAMSSTRVVGESGQGLVRATLSGDGRLVKLRLSPAIGKEGPRAIEELVAAAVNRAHDRLREETRRHVLDNLPSNVDPTVLLRALP